ncbi:MAG: UDP-glucose/GDP-mannose dehydrogenase family protein, partial [Anaerolineae bacterium]|nr:UDP-glucose/GDP-mannose dehydrogenase family protein [Anaerolineae bacterium]
MKIIVAGTGFVGLTHAAVCSEYGHEVYAYDIDKQRIAAYRSAEAHQIERYVNEPGLAAT